MKSWILALGMLILPFGLFGQETRVSPLPSESIINNPELFQAVPPEVFAAILDLETKVTASAPQLKNQAATPEVLQTAWDNIDLTVGAKYPEAKIRDSGLNDASRAVIKEWTEKQDPRLFVADAPMQVYDEAARRIQGQPKKETYEDKLTKVNLALSDKIDALLDRVDLLEEERDAWKDVALHNKSVAEQNALVASRNADTARRIERQVIQAQEERRIPQTQEIEIRGNTAFGSDGTIYHVRRDTMGNLHIEP